MSLGESMTTVWPLLSVVGDKDVYFGVCIILSFFGSSVEVSRTKLITLVRWNNWDVSPPVILVMFPELNFPSILH